MGTRSVFLDRDGTINVEKHHLHRADQMQLIAGAGEAIRLLHRARLKVVVVTNQSAIGRGLLSLDELRRIHAEMCEQLRRDAAGIDAIYSCPHHPSAAVGRYRVECGCRKPQPGALYRASRDLGIDLSRSFLVGDKISDLEAGSAAGCTTILVRTGYGRDSERQLLHRKNQPDHVAENILEAAHWILARLTITPSRRSDVA
ncbi:MAG: HAD-IIIA family hydrolase [Candidatus Latescibacterota bacterium]|nr:MAG: HAD-IIIA family hydrolase [Candidatus Latescibacterota bacterium]